VTSISPENELEFCIAIRARTLLFEQFFPAFFPGPFGDGSSGGEVDVRACGRLPLSCLREEISESRKAILNKRRQHKQQNSKPKQHRTLETSSFSRSTSPATNGEPDTNEMDLDDEDIVLEEDDDEPEVVIGDDLRAFDDMYYTLEYDLEDFKSQLRLLVGVTSHQAHAGIIRRSSLHRSNSGL
jgi:hypothetical protein